MNYYINVYEVDRQYGGPEEGGWWYDTGTLVHTETATTEAKAHARRDFLRETEYRNTGDASSVIYRGGEYAIEVSNEPGKNYPEERPHYE